MGNETSESSSVSTVGTMLSMPLVQVMDPNVLIMAADYTAQQATDKIKEKNAKLVLVSHSEEIIGVVSKSDLVFKVVKENLPLNKTRLRQIMSSPVYSLSGQASLQDALNYMDKYNVRQIVVTSGTSVLGLASRRQLVERVEKASISAVESLTQGAPLCIINPKAIQYVKDIDSGKATCPYCSSPFDTKEALSKHIDKLHTGPGLLEGDTRKY